MRKKCLKCGYVRQEDEIAKEYECPQCGIIYDKYEAALKKKENSVAIAEENALVTPDNFLNESENRSGSGIKIQDIILILVCFLILLNVMFPPFHFIYEDRDLNEGYSFILSPPANGFATVDKGLLSIQISVCMIIGGIFYFLLRDSEKVFFQKKGNICIFNENNTCGIKNAKTLPRKFYDEYKPRPWRRYFARLLDNFFIGYFSLYGILIFSGITTYNNIIAISIMTCFLMLPIEALLLSVFGYTLGKYLLGIQVVNSCDEKLSYSKALFRSILVFIIGNACGIPCICLITNLLEYYSLSKNGYTYWDEKIDSVVKYQKIGILRAACFIFAIFLMSVISLIFKQLYSEAL
ncbi:RDD family protein [Candidatus Electronema sp. JC]|uniref:RDD family protein n=1 Tax=Candidatus Electronema sp. JC TaxID=3401570 RepID=UPI003B433141